MNDAYLALDTFNNIAESLTEDETDILIRDEARNSYELAMGKGLGSCGFDLFDKSEPDEESDDINDLTKAIVYAVDSADLLPLSSRLLKNIHYIVCASAAYDKKYRGEFRNSPVWIGSAKSTLKTARFVAPINEDMTEAIRELENYINYSENEDVLVRAALIHYQFEMIHPFIDANGRVGRILNTLYLLEQKVIKHPVIQLSEVLKKRSAAYYAQIQNVHETGIYEKWIRFFLQALTDAAILTTEKIKTLHQ